MKLTNRAKARGFSLIEVLVSMTIFSVGVLGLLGMYANSVTNYSDAKYRTDATLLAESLINSMWVNRANVANYAYGGTGANTTLTSWLAEMNSALPKAVAVVTVGATTATGTQVTVQINWQPPDAVAQSVTHQHVETATIQNP